MKEEAEVVDKRLLEYTVTFKASVVVVANGFVAVRPKIIEYTWKPTAKHVKASNPHLLEMIRDKIMQEADLLLYKKLNNFLNPDGTFQRRIEIELVDLNRDSYAALKKPRVSIVAEVTYCETKTILKQTLSWQAQKHDFDESIENRIASAVDKVKRLFKDVGQEVTVSIKTLSLNF